MASYKLTYFDFHGGRGEPVRIALHAAGVDFDDERWSFPEFMEKREGTRFNSVPVMHVDGVEVSQSNAMCRYVGRMAGLYPDDTLQALYCDEVMDAVEDLIHYIVPTMRLEGDALKEARAELAAGWMTVYLRGLADCLARGGGEYFADNRLTMADLKVFVQVRSVVDGRLDHIDKAFVESVAPTLIAHCERIGTESVVQAYYASVA